MDLPSELQASAPAEDLGPGELVIDEEIRKALNGVNPMSLTPEELSYRLSLAGVEKSKVAIVTQSARAIQARRAAEIRLGRNFTPDEVVEMLRAGLHLWVEEIDAGAAAFSTHLISWLRVNFGVSLSEKNPAAVVLLENEVREELGNGVIAKVRARVENDVQGVRTMEFEKARTNLPPPQQL